MNLCVSCRNLIGAPVGKQIDAFHVTPIGQSSPQGVQCVRVADGFEGFDEGPHALQVLLRHGLQPLIPEIHPRIECRDVHRLLVAQLLLQVRHIYEIGNIRHSQPQHVTFLGFEVDDNSVQEQFTPKGTSNLKFYFQ